MNYKSEKISTKINTEQLSRANEFEGRWIAQWNPETKTFYCVGRTKEDGKWKTIRLNRWLTNSPVGKIVGYKNHDTLDNTQDNIRTVTIAENHQNRPGANKNSTSNIRGVYFRKDIEKWMAHITINYKKKCLGYFNTKEEAAKVAKEARSKLMPYSDF